MSQLVGDGREGNSLKHLSSELFISTKLSFPGWLRPADARAAMENPAVSVHPSSGVGDIVPTAIRECMAVGRTVVPSGVVGIPELRDDGWCGIRVPERDTTAVADAMQQLLENDELRRRYADAARKYVQKKFDLAPNGGRLAQTLFATNRQEPAVLLSSPGAWTGDAR